MLSRIAESLFWIGRYVERADVTARLLQAHLRLLIEDTSANEVDGCRNLLALMGVDHVEEPRVSDLLGVLVYGSREPASIYACWAAARDNARRAREVIPLEVWECINSTWQQLPSGSSGVTGAYADLNWARDRSALFNGIARSIMVRDDGWQFMSMGRSLEQVDMTSRLVASASLSTGSTGWPAVLRGAGGYDAFLRTYPGLHTDRESAQFLIADSRFPRSVMHGLGAVSDSLRKLGQSNPGSTQTTAVERTLGQLRAHLEYTEVSDLLSNLDDEMGAVQDATAKITEIVARTYFAAADPTAWITEGTR